MILIAWQSYWFCLKTVPQTDIHYPHALQSLALLDTSTMCMLLKHKIVDHDNIWRISNICDIGAVAELYALFLCKEEHFQIRLGTKNPGFADPWSQVCHTSFHHWQVYLGRGTLDNSPKAQISEWRMAWTVVQIWDFTKVRCIRVRTSWIRVVFKIGRDRLSNTLNHLFYQTLRKLR